MLLLSQVPSPREERPRPGSDRNIELAVEEEQRRWRREKGTRKL